MAFICAYNVFLRVALISFIFFFFFFVFLFWNNCFTHIFTHTWVFFFFPFLHYTYYIYIYKHDYIFVRNNTKENNSLQRWRENKSKQKQDVYTCSISVILLEITTTLFFTSSISEWEDLRMRVDVDWILCVSAGCVLSLLKKTRTQGGLDYTILCLAFNKSEI